MRRALIFALLLAGPTSLSWGWRGGFRVGIGVWPGVWYGGPYYDEPYAYPYGYPYGYYPYPYYYPDYYPDPYYVPYETENPPPQEDGRRDLTYIENQIARERETVNYYYDDGDISREQRHAAIKGLRELLEKARAEAKAGGGAISRQQEKDLLNELHRLPSNR
jgi:hypothetical protein